MLGSVRLLKGCYKIDFKKKKMAKARGLAGKGAIELGEWSLTLGLTWCKREQTLMWVQ